MYEIYYKNSLTNSICNQNAIHIQKRYKSKITTFKLKQNEDYEKNL